MFEDISDEDFQGSGIQYDEVDVIETTYFSENKEKELKNN